MNSRAAFMNSGSFYHSLIFSQMSSFPFRAFATNALKGDTSIPISALGCDE